MPMTDKKAVTEFAVSMRGQLILSQALCLAIEKLNEMPENRREVSNISDMQYLLDHLFPIYKAVQEAT